MPNPLMTPDKAKYLPTPEQIAAECRLIQESWSTYEYTVRAGRNGCRDALIHRAPDPRFEFRER